ncbi:hypothetical protein MTR67_011558 [Solanum verrucosum]|uniref:Bifunctional inhibitor/plant lipid transfer protein/seed storage helical domain-containing protein n=2 Tax=Solanum TaxID=4107 RepID=A0AAF0TJB8_SOLVR|nr:hypothetical protein MTR67_011558 [Solanum verrucosum]
MKKGSSISAILLVTTLVILLGELLVVESVICDIAELQPCTDAIIKSQPPSPACCTKLIEQLPCICGYIEDPKLKPYIKFTPQAKKVFETCGVHLPKC